MKAVNDAYAEVTANATDVLVSVVKTNDAAGMTAKVVALIKKFFD